jgi:beta-galactosidase
VNISYDHRAITVNGERKLILAGSIHYPRSTPAMWPDLMDKAAAAGLNGIETYLFWNLHERRRNVYDFSGQLDLRRFIELAAERGLYFILRIGPYICAETDYGGFPAWLREVPGIRMRTYNEPFMREMEQWVRHLCGYLRPYFAPTGGPIIMAQIENEYDYAADSREESGRRYAQWAADLGRSLGLGIPWVMCEGAAEGVLSTINGTYAHHRLDKHFADHPDQPAIWTENWVANYTNFGCPHRYRSGEDLAYALARFVAGGGTGSIYYMFHGGTNFNRESVYLQATSYDCDAILDEFGLARTKYHHTARLHRILNQYAGLLLSVDPPQPIPLGDKQAAYIYRNHVGAVSNRDSGDHILAFLCNDDEKDSATVTYEGKKYTLRPHSVILLDGDRVLMDTSKVEPSHLVRRTLETVVGRRLTFAWWPEPMPGDRVAAADAIVTSDHPLNQLDLTHNETDYCWYSTRITIPESDAGRGVLILNQVADVACIFIDGKLAATTKTPLIEDRGPLTGEGFTQSFELDLPAGERMLDILCAAVGMIKGDWMIGRENMALEHKGLWGGVTWDGRPVGGPWTMRAGLVGERCGICGDGACLIRWDTDGERRGGVPLTWWRAEFDRPLGDALLALDLLGMTKGLVWINGRCLGRYWVFGSDPDPEAAGYDERYTHLMQRYYHVPRDWLADRNTLILFEEIGGDVSTIRICAVG